MVKRLLEVDVAVFIDRPIFCTLKKLRVFLLVKMEQKAGDGNDFYERENHSVVETGGVKVKLSPSQNKLKKT